MVFNSKMILCEILAIFVISGAILDKSRAIRESNLEDECYMKLTQDCKSLIFEPRCDYARPSWGDCCWQLLANVTSECFYDVMLKEAPCKDNATWIWEDCHDL